MKFEASTFVEAGKLTLRLNGTVVLQDTGKVTLEIQPGRTHEVSWHVKGQSGTSYGISISSPAVAEFQLRKVIRVQGHESNFIQFKT